MLLFLESKRLIQPIFRQEKKKGKEKKSLLRVNTKENSMDILHKILKIKLSYDPAIPLPCIYSKELKSGTKEITELQCSMQHYSQ